MEKILHAIISLYLFVFTVSSAPYYAIDDLALEDIYDVCNTITVNSLARDTRDPVINSILNEETWEDGNSLFDLFTQSRQNSLTGSRVKRFIDGKKLAAISQNMKTRRLLANLNQIHKMCLEEYTSDRRPIENIKKDDEKISILDSDNFEDRGLTDLLSAQGLTETAKRAAIGVNPTGWRRRRSQTDESNEDYHRFLKNVRELLEKRERLQFNPTGW